MYTSNFSTADKLLRKSAILDQISLILRRFRSSIKKIGKKIRSKKMLNIATPHTTISN